MGSSTCRACITDLLNELLLEIMSYLNVFDLHTFKNTCSQFHDLSNAGYRSKLCATLRIWLSNPTALLQLLSLHNGSISGHGLLLFIDSDFDATDIDVNIEVNGIPACIQLFQQDGYTLVTPSPLVSLSIVMDSSMSITSMVKPALPPSHAIKKAWSTLYIGGATIHGLYLGYPRLTQARVALLNHTLTRYHHSIKLDVDAMISAMNQLNFGHAFDFNDLPTEALDKAHAKGPISLNETCTHTSRTMGDTYTGVFIFKYQRLQNTNRPKSFSTSAWVLGGDRCRVLRCAKKEYMSIQAMEDVAHSDPDNMDLICCEAFSDVRIVDTAEFSLLYEIFN